MTADVRDSLFAASYRPVSEESRDIKSGKKQAIT